MLTQTRDPTFGAGRTFQCLIKHDGVMTFLDRWFRLLYVAFLHACIKNGTHIKKTINAWGPITVYAICFND